MSSLDVQFGHRSTSPGSSEKKASEIWEDDF